ncbi:MAG: hypothetical protein GX968_04595 [Tissierellia bacterium]|nr:hypothetical protein [Tissierellia bacterium]
MEAIKLNNKENLIDAYGLKPQLFYDIEGSLIENNGKDIKIEKNIDNRNIIYSLRLKEEIVGEIGKKVLINKENILSIKTEEKKEKGFLSINKEEIIKKLDLEDNEENSKAIEYLAENEIPITKENLASFLMSKKYLGEVVENLDLEKSIKLLEKGIDLRESPLQEIAEALEEIQMEDKDFNLLEILGLDRKLNYKEAEIIAKKIYGQKMGKDVYDSIIALHNEGVDINKENIEEIMEIMDKAYDLKNYEEQKLIMAIKEEVDINMANLYKIKHSYEIENLEKNIATPLYEEFLIEKEKTIEEILIELDLENTMENINIIRGLIHYDLDFENYEKIIQMKESLQEFLELLNENTIAKLIDRDIDILNTEIEKLIDIIKNEESDNENINTRGNAKILKDIEELKAITDRELFQLIKSGEDFKIENLQEIIDTNLELKEDLNSKSAEKVLILNNIYNTLDELDSNTINFAITKHNSTSLNHLYEANVQLKEMGEVLVETINPTEESIIRQEYLNAKANTSLNLIRISIKEGVALEHMPLDELNKYIDKKVNRYREIDKIAEEIKSIKGKEDYLIPKIIKNQLNMNLGDLKYLNDLLNSNKGFSEELNNLLKEENSETKAEIQNLEFKVKEFSNSLKDNKENSKENYKEVLNALENLNNSSDFGGNSKENMDNIQKYLSLQNNLEEDIILQLPLEENGIYKNLNLIIPKGNRGIDKNNMYFYFNLNAGNLGDIRVNLEVIGRQVYMELESEKSEIILENKNILEEGLSKIGYDLREIRLDR